jgi:hypothetical protein
METQESADITPPFLSSALGGVWSSPRHSTPTVHWIGCWLGPQSWSGHCRDEKNVLPLPGIKPNTHPALSYPEPSWLLYLKEREGAV